MKKECIILFIILIISVCFPIYATMGVYDVKGNKYDDYLDIHYYSEGGSEYKREYIDGECYLINVSDKKEKYNVKEAYVNEAGYIEFCVDNLYEIRAEKMYEDKEGDLYFSIEYVSWDKLGLLNVSWIIED